MAFIVTNGTKYVKHTCTRYGPFYGTLLLTDKEEEARRWTRKTDANSFIQVVSYRSGFKDGREPCIIDNIHIKEI